MTDRLTALLDGGAPVLADGAMGTMLFEAGLQFGDPPEVWNLAHPDVVRAHPPRLPRCGRAHPADQYVRRQSLPTRALGHEDRVDELNRTAAILLRAEVDAAGGDALVAGDIGPSGQIMAPLGTLEHDDAVAGFAEQAASLAAGGVDCIWIETMSDLAEITRGDRGRPGAPTRRCPIIATMTFDTRGHTMMGVSPERAAAALAELGVQAFGGNCGNGPDELTPVIAKMHAAQPDARLVAKSNVGHARARRRCAAVYLADPAMMAGCARRDADAGATDHRRLLRQHAGAPSSDGGGARAERPRARPAISTRRAYWPVRAA